MKTARMHPLQECQSRLSDDRAGERMFRLIEQLFPICRSITGNGLRQSLDIVGEHLPLTRSEVATGTPVFDWTIPNEWNIRDAWIKDASGQKIVDFQRSNLHVMSYSTPVQGHFSLADLKPHLHSDPEHPDWIPYRTSYYKEAWGFCLSHQQLQALADSEYEVCIDSDLAPGSLSYAECLIPGERPEEVLLFAHICHPSLCNDNLSGVALLVELGRYLRQCRLKWSYRLIFAPATIGSITWLSRNEAHLPRIQGGLILSVAGDPGALTYKRSRRSHALIDRASARVLAERGLHDRVLGFSPWGYDERQFCSPGINLPMGRLTRSPNGAYPEYHSSADNLDLVRPQHLQDTLDAMLAIFHVVETDTRYQNLQPKGEPQLGRRGLYQMMGGFTNIGELQHALLWVLNYSDGEHSLLDIAEQSSMPYSLLQQAATMAIDADLLSPIP
jgi:aminopeptidase-like protein